MLAWWKTLYEILILTRGKILYALLMLTFGEDTLWNFNVDIGKVLHGVLMLYLC
jgi:hypothetical protein